jgi:addiction module RelB/DinJ family antitoxin
MAQTSLLQVRIEPSLKQQAEKLFHEIGIDTASAVRMFFKQAIVFGGIPFNIHIGVPQTDKKAEAKLAFQRLQKYKKILPADFNYKKELEAIRSERYEKYENSHRH